MSKKKVTAFFLLLVLFATGLAIAEIIRYGSLTGFFSMNNTIENSTELADESAFVGEIASFLFLIFAFILVAAYIVKYLHTHHERSHDSSHKKKRLIKIDFMKG